MVARLDTTPHKDVHVRDSLFSSDSIADEHDENGFLFEYAPVGYLVFDSSGHIRSANPMGATLLNCPREELIGQAFEQFVADEDWLVFSEFIEEVFETRVKETCRLKLAQSRPVPSYVRIEALAIPSKGECLAVLVDITEKKKAEQALAESKYHLAKAQSMTHVGSWSFDVATGEVNASDELLRILRLTPEQMNQEMFASVVHPEDKDTVLQHLNRGMEQGVSYEIEHRLLFDDGSSRWVYTIVEPVLDLNGVVIRLYGTTQDVTQRKQAEVDISNKTNELQAIFDSIEDGICVYNQEGQLQHHNLISPALFAGKIFEGSPCRHVFHPESESCPPTCPVLNALDGERSDASLVHVDAKANPAYIDVTATPIKDALGGKNRALVFFRDVTDKRMQEMRLIQTEKMSSLGVLATGIAHEINNPLTSVACCSEALIRRFNENPGLNDEAVLSVFPAYLDTILTEAYRCKKIIDNLLSFGRNADDSSSKVDINASLVEIIELLQHQTKYQDVSVISSLDKSLPRIKGNPSSLRQVFMNLLVNALQSIVSEGQIEVTTEVSEDSRVVVSVRDTGCGMPQGIIDRIWEPFFTTKDVGQGVGLGLSISYNIVKEHGGKITLESTEGEGSLFIVSLPI